LADTSRAESLRVIQPLSSRVVCLRFHWRKGVMKRLAAICAVAGLMLAVVGSAQAAAVLSDFGSGWPGYGGPIDKIQLLYNGGSDIGFALPGVTVTQILVNWDAEGTFPYGEGDASKWSETFNNGKKVVFEGADAPAYGLSWTASFVNPVVGDIMSVEYFSSSNPIDPPYAMNYAWAGEADGWQYTDVPEPMTLALLGLGGLVLRRRKA
jgi:hypothetical protein